MTTKGNFSNETTIYVSTRSKLNTEQTQSITNELLRIIGGANNQHGLNFRFIESDNLTEAHASVDNNLRLSINN